MASILSRLQWDKPSLGGIYSARNKTDFVVSVTMVFKHGHIANKNNRYVVAREESRRIFAIIGRQPIAYFM